MSPTGALAAASLISGLGQVVVSLLKSRFFSTMMNQ
jgi:hypothetical protein